MRPNLGAASMTVSSTTAQQTFNCDGSTTIYTCPFRVLDSGEVRGFLITVADNTSTELISGVDFVVSGVGDANAVVTTTATYSNAYQLKVRRATDRLQLVDYRDNDLFPAESHEGALDRLTHIAQEVDDDVGRALLFPDPEVGAVLPTASERASLLLGFDDDGDPIAVAPTSGSAADLALNLASTATGKGLNLVGFSELNTPTAGSAAAWLRKTARTVNLSALATGGSGTQADPYTGWATPLQALAWGSGVTMEDAWYTSAGGIVHPNLSIVCPGRNGVFQFTGISGYAGNIYVGGILPNGTARPGYGSTATVYNMGAGALSADQVAFTFASVSGLAVGDEGYMALGVDSTDGGQSHVRMFNRVVSIVSNTVTFAVPLPEAVAAFPGSPAYAFSPTFHEFVKWSGGVPENIRLEGFKVTQTAGPSYDPSVWVARCRNAFVDIHFMDVRSGLYVCESVGVRGRISADRARYNLLGAYGSTDAFVDAHCDALDGLGVQYESQCRNIGGRMSMRGSTSKANNSYLAVIGNTKGVRFDAVNLSSAVAIPNAPGLAVTSGSSVSVGDVVLGSGVNNFPLRHCDGSIAYGGLDYGAKSKRFRLAVVLTKNMSAVSFALPDGLLRSVRGQLSDSTGVTRVRMATSTVSRDLLDTSNTINFFPAAGAFGELTTDAFVTVGSDSASYAFNYDPTGHALLVTTDGTATEGARLILEGEFYPLADDGVSGSMTLGNRASLCGAKTLDFAAPGAVPGSPADQTITVTGAAIGDRVTVSAPVTIPAGFILQAFVSAADTVTVRWTQVHGAAADPDGAGGVYRVDVWK